MTQLYFNTVNRHKMAEISTIFSDVDVEIKFLEHNIQEVLSHNLETVIKSKAEEAYKACRVPVIVEHGALCIEYLNNFPGALSKPMWDLMDAKICKLIPYGETRAASVYSGVCYCDGKVRKSFIEKTEGTIAIEGRGTFGFQFDPIFIPNGVTLTYAEMALDEKLKHSQAVKAYNMLKKELRLSKKK